MEALYYGIERYGSDLKSQEFSNSVYGLGLMKADINNLPSSVMTSLILAFRRVVVMMNLQEVCSTLHGFAKMNCDWEDMRNDLKQCILLCVGLGDADKVTSRSLCLACSIYSLGLLRADWYQIPKQVIFCY